MIKNKMKKKRMKKFFAVVNSKPVIGIGIGIGIFIMLSLAMVFAGNVIVKEGTISTGNLHVLENSSNNLVTTIEKNASYITINPNEKMYVGDLVTTNETPMNILIIPVEENTIVEVEVDVVAGANYDYNTGESGSWKRIGTFYWLSPSSLVQVGAVTNVHSNAETLSSSAVTLNRSGNNVYVRVTGYQYGSIDWTAYAKVRESYMGDYGGK